MHVKKLICLIFSLILFSSAFASEYMIRFERNNPGQAKSWVVAGDSAVNLSLLYYLNTAGQNMSLEQQGKAYQYLLYELDRKFDLAQADQHLYQLQVVERDEDKIVLDFAHDELGQNEIKIPRLAIKAVFLGINEIKGNQRLVVIVQSSDDRYAAFVALPQGAKLSPQANCRGSKFTLKVASLDPVITGRQEVQIGHIVQGTLNLNSYFKLQNLGTASIFPVNFNKKKAENIQFTNLTWIERHR
ncbi:MAG: hypothetical protein J6Y94_00195 [Bacteriovoracaceae bacterium]|nr:hypothetical protein [Bacteriovoracaceae bacterium]